MINCMLIVISEADEMLKCLVIVQTISHLESQILTGKCTIRIFIHSRKFVSDPLSFEIQHKALRCSQCLNKYILGS
jgi:hypothetical protein